MVNFLPVIAAFSTLAMLIASAAGAPLAFEGRGPMGASGERIEQSTVHALMRRAYSGDGTAYFPGTGGLGTRGACGTELASEPLGACAVSDAVYDAAGGSLCGKCVIVHGPSGTGRCKILDRCAGCGYGALDMTAPTFQQVMGSPRRVPVTWEIVDCASFYSPPPPPPPSPASSGSASASSCIPKGQASTAQNSIEVSPVGNTDFGGQAFKCVPTDAATGEANLLTPIKITDRNEVACLSADSVNCIVAPTIEACEKLAATATSYSPYVECGARHYELWCQTGYDQGDKHWCTRGRRALLGN